MAWIVVGVLLLLLAAMQSDSIRSSLFHPFGSEPTAKAARLWIGGIADVAALTRGSE